MPSAAAASQQRAAVDPTGRASANSARTASSFDTRASFPLVTCDEPHVRTAGRVVPKRDRAPGPLDFFPQSGGIVGTGKCRVSTAVILPCCAATHFPDGVCYQSAGAQAPYIARSWEGCSFWSS